GMQLPSEYSHSWPLAKLLLGQAIGPVVPSVSAPVQTPVLALQVPSPFLDPAPSLPPRQVSNTCGSVTPNSLIGLLLASLEQTSACPISCCMSTPPCSAAQGTWFCCLAELYSAWKVNGVPLQVLGLVFMKPFLALAVMKPV